jgi:adenine/guanine phosphoribosyltransferase-like PRPP-binding protein
VWARHRESTTTLNFNSTKILPVSQLSTSTLKRRIRTGYLHDVLDPSRLPDVIKHTSKLARKLRPDTVLVRGMSGILVGLPVALELGIHFGFARRDEELSHGLPGIEGPFDLGRFIIIDDFVQSGMTLTRLLKAVDDHDYESRGMLCGVIFYNQLADHWPSMPGRIADIVGQPVPVGIVDLDQSPSSFFLSNS